ncbi:MAG: desulfoferrodoxin [Candidatus Paceibacterota bacterium]
MNQIKQICKCNVCGNIVEILHAGAGQLVCCGQPMEKMAEKEFDEGTEKHLPVIERSGNSIRATIGKIIHPMEEEHFIEWIEVTVGSISYRKFLRPGQLPEIKIETLDIGEVIVRTYCNVHGLWASNKVIEVPNEKINFNQFEKVDLRLARVLEASYLEGSEKLVRLMVELGPEKRQILAGIGKFYSPEELIGKKIVIVANLEPKMLLGQESQGMVLAAHDEQGLSLLVVERDIASGIRIS